jgi:hypothetical integral membrane protein (TIGR02206 family)
VPYSLGQIGWGVGIALVASLGVLLCRESRSAATWVRILIAIVLVSFELQRFLVENVRFPDRMPFYLCNISTWAAVLACLTLNPLAVEFLYFTGLTAAVMALLTPDMGSVWPAPFFLNHGGIVLAASVLVFGRVVRMRRIAPFRAYSMGVIYFAAGGVFDWCFGTNYSFTLHKPFRTSLLDYLGPWPIYWLSAALIGSCLVWLLWLPVRRMQTPKVLFTAQDRERLLA